MQNDVLKEYIARGTYIYPPAAALRLITDMFAYCGEMVPQWHADFHQRLSHAGGGRDGGAGGCVYTGRRNCLRAGGGGRGAGGGPVCAAALVLFACHNNFLEEVAKFRAARRMWARIMRDRFGATAEKALMLRFHTQTGGSTLTAQQPQNNIVRTALQAMSAVLGGTQSLHTNGYDEALALPTEESARLALRTQQIIAYESGVTAAIDPLAGSYYVETLTNEMERRALEYLEQIDAMGGMLRAIESGFVQQEIQNAAYEFQKSVDSREQVLVGVNAFR